MLRDARKVDDGAVLRADVCIVGAGAAGISMARRLAGSGREVLLLESGGLEPDADTADLNAGEVTGEPMRFFSGTAGDLGFMRLRYLGGTTNHWGGWCNPIPAADFEERPHVAHSGWPIGRADLDPYYVDAQTVCQLGPFEYESAWWSEQGFGEAVLDTPSVTTTMYQLSPPTRFGEVYRRELDDARDITVYLWANVVDLELEGDRVNGLEVAVLDGPTFRVEATTVVLATGGVEVPRLLLASNGQRPDGVGNEHGLVGRYFAEHPHLHFSAVLSPSEADLVLYGLRVQDLTAHGGPNAQSTFAALVPTPEASEAHGLPGMGAVFNTMLAPPALEELEVNMHDVATLVTGVEGREPGERGVLVLLFEQRPNPDSRVQLVRERDALGMPRVRLDWRLTSADREGMDRSVDFLARELTLAGLGRMQTLVDGVRPAERDLEVGFHHMGTARMHDDPRRGVVDRDCRVHGIANLFVAGSAVFTTASWAHPTLTVVALALRLADHLAAGAGR
jgi:choline dehydrogenase-like flavoprotein